MTEGPSISYAPSNRGRMAGEDWAARELAMEKAARMDLVKRVANEDATDDEREEILSSISGVPAPDEENDRKEYWQGFCGGVWSLLTTRSGQ
jgi:hypothetical protein